MRIIGRLLRLFAALAFAAPAAGAAADLGRVEQLIEQGANQFRTEQGASRLAQDDALERAARGLADFMAQNDQYGHEADGTNVGERVRRAKYDACLVSENIAYQQSTPPLATNDLARTLVEGWKNSPGHRANLLEPGITATGVAVARSPRTGRNYAVQVFARPRSLALQFRVTNSARNSADYTVGGRRYTVGRNEVRIHTVCTTEEVTFAGVENAEGRTFRPSAGDNFVVRGGPRLTVKPE